MSIHRLGQPLVPLLSLCRGLLDAAPGGRRKAIAYAYGVICHLAFGVAVLSMIGVMYSGMTASFGTVPWPWAIGANALLLAQFPLTHSFLLTDRGRRLLVRLAPSKCGVTLSTTTYAVIASLQLGALFLFWTPSGLVWWAADGVTLWVITVAYALAWMLLGWASMDAGAEVQSGALGWMSLAQNKRPVYPDMPVAGLFRVIRQPIYASFALTLWTVPVWTPDQLMLAIALTVYCVAAPRLKERRFEDRFGERFDTYRRRVPYIVPRLGRKNPCDTAMTEH